MKKVRLDLFKLHDENDKGQGRIKAVINSELKLELKILIQEIQKGSPLKIKDIADYLGIGRYEFYRCLKRKIPLVCLCNLLELWEKITKNSIKGKQCKLFNKINYLSHGAGNTYKIVKCQKYLTENQCKIIGAVLADGHLKNGMLEYSIIVRDGTEDTVRLFCKWVEEEFGIKLQANFDKSQNLWYVSFGNKIIFRYLNKIYDVHFGKKASIAKMSEIVRKSSLNFQKTFVTGVVMFDGGVDHRTGYFDLTTKSIYLVKDVEQVLKKFNVNPDYVSDSLDPISGVYKLRIRQKEKLKKFLEIFLEPNTMKWSQLNFHVNGAERFTNLKETTEALSRLFPQVRNGITFEAVINIVNNLQYAKMEDVKKKLNRKNTVVYEYLKCLENWEILISRRRGIYKVWSINPNLLKQKEVNMPKEDMTERIKEAMNEPTHIRNVATSSQ
jgi:hypothetical protein